VLSGKGVTGESLGLLAIQVEELRLISTFAWDIHGVVHYRGDRCAVIGSQED